MASLIRAGAGANSRARHDGAAIKEGDPHRVAHGRDRVELGEDDRRVEVTKGKDEPVDPSQTNDQYYAAKQNDVRSSSKECFFLFSLYCICIT